MTKEQEYQAVLNKELKEYEFVTEMTETERIELHKWVKTGHSVHENTAMAVYSDGYPMDFLDVYRDEEYIRQTTKDMSSEEQEKFALNYYGWTDYEDKKGEQTGGLIDDESFNSIKLD